VTAEGEPHRRLATHRHGGGRQALTSVDAPMIGAAAAIVLLTMIVIHVTSDDVRTLTHGLRRHAGAAADPR